MIVLAKGKLPFYLHLLRRVGVANVPFQWRAYRQILLHLPVGQPLCSHSGYGGENLTWDFICKKPQ